VDSEGSVQLELSRVRQTATRRDENNGGILLDLEKVGRPQVGVAFLFLVSIDAASMTNVPLRPPSVPTVPTPSIALAVPFAGNTHIALV
jgi:hypothetical protein